MPHLVCYGTRFWVFDHNFFLEAMIRLENVEDLIDRETWILSEHEDGGDEFE
ncbi:MAG: hypothetical protein HY512_00365 [Candidatus Aenigmarchaeota archaeon]|nr:hypothetical protein [Candidatus Aenigmarchaeota archaeon]